MNKKLFISADHGGFELKKQIIQELEQLRESNTSFFKLEIADLGAEIHDPHDDYPHFAFNLARQVVSNGADDLGYFGLLICRSGIGMTIAANKVDGAYAALCSTSELAAKAREHNDANILVLDSDYAAQGTEFNPLAIIETFLTTDFEAGRHERRVEQIKRYELKRSGQPVS